MMDISKTVENIRQFCKRLNGTTIQLDITEYMQIVTRIKLQIETLENLSKSELNEIITRIRKCVQSAEIPDEQCMIEFYALMAVVVKRVLHMEPFDVQLAGAVALHRRKLVEMQTGEGKTLTALFPACLNALCGKDVHVITFNDYLAERDCAWMKPVVEFLGLTSGVITGKTPREKRKEIYKCDIVYSTAREIGYDYLRDGLVYTQSERVLRDLHYAIVDEADSVMIDESRVPMIVAGDALTWCGSDDSDELQLKKRAAEVVKSLLFQIDYKFDQYKRNVFLTEQGITKVEKEFDGRNLYDQHSTHLLSIVYYALHAETLLCKGRDYIIRNGLIEIIDEFTGRAVPDRKWPEGLHDALVVKEGLSIQKRGVILSSMTMRYFFQAYSSLSAMTATAQGAEEEFGSVYNLHIVVIPPNRKSVRIDYADTICIDKKTKWNSVVDEIVRVHRTGRPVLAGTVDIGETELLSKMLTGMGIICQVLNAENDACEAQIIADAGKMGAVTISTNMAGRGTDIKLGGSDQKQWAEVVSLGGLFVIGTNRHESIRIDNQLRGRAGRQGDPGETKFFISLEDDIFDRYKLKELLSKSFFRKNNKEQLSSAELPVEINRIQRIIEGQHYEAKLTLYKYSDLVECQRRSVLEFRDTCIDSYHGLEVCRSELPDVYAILKQNYSDDEINTICRCIVLKVIDKSWICHLEEVGVVKDSIHLRKFGKQDPLFEFKSIVITMFNQMMYRCEELIIEEISAMVHCDLETIRKKYQAGSSGSTWTYLVSDDPFKDRPDFLTTSSNGVSAMSGFMWPLIVLWYLLTKKRRNDSGCLST